MNEIAELFSLRGKTAVVTGTSAGIGSRLARTLVMAGAQVVAMARRTTEVDLPSSSPGELLPMSVDLAQRDQVADAARASLVALGGRVDILVNNAAFLAGGVKAEDESHENIRQTLAVNLEAPILLAQTFYPGMPRCRKRFDHQCGVDSGLGRDRPATTGGLRRIERWAGGHHEGVGSAMEPLRHPGQ